MNSDQIMESLQPFGVVRVHQFDDKRFLAVARLFMHGMSAEVKSESNHNNMLDALSELQGKVFAVVNVGAVSPGLEQLR